MEISCAPVDSPCKDAEQGLVNIAAAASTPCPSGPRLLEMVDDAPHVVLEDDHLQNPSNIAQSLRKHASSQMYATCLVVLLTYRYGKHACTFSIST